jgi:hypothetical protein
MAGGAYSRCREHFLQGIEKVWHFLSIAGDVAPRTNKSTPSGNKTAHAAV